MADDEIRKVAEEAFDRLAAELRAGKSEAFQNYLNSAARFPHRSLRNILLIAAQRPTATDLRSYHDWADLGRYVKAGEKGVMVFARVETKERDSFDRNQSTDQTASSKNGRFRPPRFRTMYLFDVQQTEGKPLPQSTKVTGDPKQYLDKLIELVTKQGISLEHDTLSARVQAQSQEGKIHLTPGMLPTEEFSVLAHELAHQMFHRADGKNRAPEEVRELQAHAVAYVVCRGVGQETNCFPADYSALYDGDKRNLAASLDVIHKNASRILDELLPPERPSPFHERPAEREIPFGSSPTQEAPAGATVNSSAPPMPDQAISFDR